MGFGTYYVHETYFNRETFDSLYKVKDAIEEETKILGIVKRQIMSLAVMTEPKKFFNFDECDDMVDLVSSKMDNLLDDYRESILRLSELKDLEEHWDECHTEKDGKKVGKYPPDYNNVYYLYGDFIETDHDEPKESEGSEP